MRYPEDFDLAEIDVFCSTYQRNRRTQTKKLNVEVLELSKLGKRREGVFQPNLACALLFANDPREVIPGARIRIIRYDGIHERFGTELNAVFSHYIDGNIPTLLRETRTVLASQLRSFQRYDSSGKLAVREEYPEEAWFEAIVNAVAHRSYNLKNQNVFVRIFDDRLVVESPGGFVPPTTSETVYDSHNPRNPYLMEAMMHLEYTFNSYEGTRRMRRAMQGARLPDPRFRQIQSLNHQVHVSLENDIATRRAEVSVETVFALPTDAMMGLNVDERTVMAVLAGAPSVNITVASLVTGKSWPTAKKLVDGLLAKGLLTPVEERRKKHDSTKSYTVPGRKVAKPD